MRSRFIALSSFQLTRASSFAQFPRREQTGPGRRPHPGDFHSESSSKHHYLYPCTGVTASIRSILYGAGVKRVIHNLLSNPPVEYAIQDQRKKTSAKSRFVAGEHPVFWKTSFISEKWSRLIKPTQNEEELEKPSVTLPGTVEKIIPSPHPSEPEKAQISVEGADDLYRELRVENALQDENGNQVALKAGAQVDVTIEADVSATRPMESSNGKEPARRS
jgi:hypothetical protein